ncbi:MAG: folate-binding protein YgfZ [Gammaproteobacteria bacterium]|nr:folate-binding protein YgfZ [Gammaproteobacteria bacterium]
MSIVSYTGFPQTPLSHLGILAVHGPDARKFLNGQLSQDTNKLAADRVELAGLHNPQGRVIALLRLVPVGTEDVLCVLPRALLPATLATLRKYLLRAKATLMDESAHWLIDGLAGDPALPAAPGSARVEGSDILWRHAADGRVIRLQPIRDEIQSGRDFADPALAAWQLADLVAGLPELHESTRGEFVAQMLNLDALGGISFTKGCYTGQEVIARAHYRGRVKRRAQRFRILEGGPALQPGQKVRLIEGNAVRFAQIVNVAQGRKGIECLAVTSFDTSRTGASGEASVSEVPLGDTPTIEVVGLPVSYVLPD